MTRLGKQLLRSLQTLRLAYVYKYIAGMVVAFYEVGFGIMQVYIYHRELAGKWHIENGRRQYLYATEGKGLQPCGFSGYTLLAGCDIRPAAKQHMFIKQ